MMKTNIPTLADVKIDFKGFQFGPDLNEAAISGSLDVTNAGIVPVINLLAKSPDWSIIGRQTDFFVSILARPSHGIKTVSDLKGKRIAVPIGGGSHPFAIEQLRKAHLAKSDVEVINVPPTEMLLAFKKGDVDAVAVWDPVAQLVREAGGMTIAEERYVGFITAHKALLNDQPDAVVKLLRAYELAYLYAAKHKGQTDAWFAKDSGMPEALVKRLRVIEPNLMAISASQIQIVPSIQAIALCQSVANTMVELGLLKTSIDISTRVHSVTT
jgi:sulfonate transport system substrate-binding protein